MVDFLLVVLVFIAFIYLAILGWAHFPVLTMIIIAIMFLSALRE